MSDKVPKTFIVDCPTCKAKVAAIEHGCVRKSGGIDQEGYEHYGIIVYLGVCPKCCKILVGESQQIGIEGYDSEYDEWAEAIRVYPEPPKTFTSERIPKVVSESIAEAVRSLQANANVAACVMFGRALEAICRDLLVSCPRYSVGYSFFSLILASAVVNRQLMPALISFLERSQVAMVVANSSMLSK